ncbi:Alpha-(1,3)-fucosyltransferase 10 [Holothuria leucospilota]|uniref:Fucosyltransferase n=1 Tax=Holothuria leucospilota TaxID=206669 RepID=A0A9Q1BBH4_HOLLE|nr:Alpha-(1,3)-fucosyltransferase 10 [Holothuria leucospilota]
MVKVDTFGKCGKKSVCGDKWTATCSVEVDKKVRSYKFFLPLENCCCEDYITEKLWHALVIGTVSIVIENLRDYLEYLDLNDTSSLEYFKWREVGIVQDHSIKEHYQNHLSDDVICPIANQCFERRSSPKEMKMFDLYGPEWKGTCHHCGNHNWICNNDHPLDHKRKHKVIWA